MIFTCHHGNFELFPFVDVATMGLEIRRSKVNRGVLRQEPSGPVTAAAAAASEPNTMGFSEAQPQNGKMVPCTLPILP